MHRGYVKLWRKSEESPVARASHLVYRLWSHILVKSNWKEKLLHTRNGYGIWCAPGTLMTSMDTLAEGISYEERGIEKRPNRKTVMAALAWMSDQGMISTESNRFGTVVFVMNWQTYQPRESMEVTPDGQPNGHPKQHQTDNQLDTTKEGEEGREGRKRKTTVARSGKPPEPSPKVSFLRHVLLTETEHKRLWALLGSLRDEYLERLDGYLEQIGPASAKARSYKSHCATIENWWRKDGKPQGEQDAVSLPRRELTEEEREEIRKVC